MDDWVLLLLLEQTMSRISREMTNNPRRRAHRTHNAGYTNMCLPQSRVHLPNAQ